MPVQFTTELPDAGTPSLGNGVEDEISVSWSDVTDYGEYRVEYKETSASTWIHHTTVGHNTTSTTINELEDGEDYDVRIRSQTEHADGAWASSSIVTKFPGATSLSVDAVTKTSIDLSWVDNADNEDGFKIVRTEHYDDGTSKTLVIDDLAANTEAYTDSTVRPGLTYDYVIRAYTEDTSADSGSVSATATDTPEPSERFYDRTWRVEIDMASGDVLQPEIVGEPDYARKINGLPTVTFKIPAEAAYLNGELNHRPMRVWRDGERLPIERVEKTNPTDSSAEIVGKGGVELLKNTSKEYDGTAIHNAGDDVITTVTSYASNVDSPNTSTSNDELMQSGDTTTDFKDNASAYPFAADVPLESKNGEVLPQKVTFGSEGETWDNAGGGADFSQISNNMSYSNGEAGRLQDDGDYLEYTFTNNHKIPESAVELQVRYDTGSNGHPAIDVSLDGTVLSSFSADTLAYGWRDFSNPSGGSYSGGAIPPGTHTIRIEATSTGDTFYIDYVAFADDRWGQLYPNTVNSDGYLDGPQKFPDQIQYETTDASTAFNVTGGELTVGLTGSTTAAKLEISNDKGASWVSATDASSVSGSFSSNGSQIRARVTMGRYGTRTTATPATGFKRERLDNYSLYADLDDTPVFTNQIFNGEAWKILRDMANQGEFIWAIESDKNGNLSVEWTSPGQRTSPQNADVTAYETSIDSSKIYEKAIVYGTSKSRNGGTFTSNHGVWVSLPNDWLVPSKQTVYDSSTDTVYARGEDYEIRYNTGEIKTLSSGDMSDATAYSVDYNHRPRGSYTVGDAGSNPRVLTVDAPNVTSDSGCSQVAVKIARELSEPREEASVTVSDVPAGWSVVEAIDLDVLPDSFKDIRVNNIDDGGSAPTLLLGNRGSVSDTLEDLRASIGAVSRRV